MAKVIPNELITAIQGKISKHSNGYFYTNKNGNTFFRQRDESFQKNRSPKQAYNSACFAYASNQINAAFATPESKQALLSAFEQADHVASDGRTYSTPRAWHMASSRYQWKSAHPFEQWLTEHNTQK